MMTPAPLAAPKILIVDDKPANLLLLVRMLTERGYHPQTVLSGKLALQCAHADPPDLILLDITMPEMDGYEVCRLLKADPVLQHLPVIFISALDGMIDKVRAFAVGGVDYITKPFQFEEVYARVQTHLQLHHLQRALEQQNAALQASNEQLRKLEDLRDNLVHMIVHDLRSPLTGIAGYLEMLEMDAASKLNELELGMLREGRSSCAVMVGMVTSLLDVNRLEQGRMPLTLARADVDELIQAALASLGCLTKQVTLQHQRQTTPLLVACDGSLVTRVLANLAGNAIKFTPTGGTVAITAEKCGDGARLCVVDTGYGIPADYHDKIFEKFGQVEARQQGKLFSTGLGLTFCKLAVVAHGGAIGVQSAVGQGSTFWFTLPGQPPPVQQTA